MGTFAGAFTRMGLALFCLSACAKGYEADPIAALTRGATIPSGGQAGASQSMVDAGTMQPPMMSEVYMGEPCQMGESAACTCSSTGTEGTKVCRYDDKSPTMGSFSECQSCAPPEMAPDPGDVDTAGRGGAGGAGGGGSGGMSGSSGRGGSGGSGGSTPPTMPRPTGRTCMPACSQSCFPVGVLACCTPLGTCGCTWAPGAYCL
jgi:hypothetical protein